MKKWIAILATTIIAICAIVDIVRDFIANDTIHYFTAQPNRLILVAIIGIIGGIAALIFDKLSSKSKRSVKLFAIGSLAGFLTLFAVWFLFTLADLPTQFGGGLLFRLAPWGLAVVAAVLWFEFYQIFKKKT